VTHVLEIDGGRIVAAGPADVADDAARRGAARVAGSDPAPGGADIDAGAGRERLPRRLHAAPDSSGSPAAPRTPPDAGPLVVVGGAEVWLGDGGVLLGIDWQLRRGEHWLVTGANGAGKSTFLRLLHGQVRPAVGGTIRWPAVN